MCSYGNIRLEANSIHWPFVLCFADNFSIDPSNHRSTRIKIISTMCFCHSIPVLRQISCRQSCTEEVSWCDTTYLDAMLIGPSKGVSRYAISSDLLLLLYEHNMLLEGGCRTAWPTGEVNNAFQVAAEFTDFQYPTTHTYVSTFKAL